MSLSLVLGILVCNESGYGFLITAHACENAPATVVSETLTLEGVTAPNGVAVHNITVNGQLIEAGVIASSVQFVDGNVVNANGVVVGNGDGDGEGTGPDGVVVGNGDGDGTGPDGVVVGNGGPCTNGVVVGNDITVSGYIVSSTGEVNGGTLTGDNISITNGVITGENLLLSGATINGGFISISGTITAIQITPTN
jgi:hypothetical protein